jgi:hypothetical protein
MATVSHYYWCVLVVLCVWRITHLLSSEDGPFDAVARLRRQFHGLWRAAVDCFYCLSLWIALPFALLLGDGWLERLLLWPALSASAILLERLTTQLHGSTDEKRAAIYFEDPHEREERSDVMLR